MLDWDTNCPVTTVGGPSATTVTTVGGPPATTVTTVGGPPAADGVAERLDYLCVCVCVCHTSLVLMLCLFVSTLNCTLLNHTNLIDDIAYFDLMVFVSTIDY